MWGSCEKMCDEKLSGCGVLWIRREEKRRKERCGEEYCGRCIEEERREERCGVEEG